MRALVSNCILIGLAGVILHLLFRIWRDGVVSVIETSQLGLVIDFAAVGCVIVLALYNIITEIRR